MIPFHIRKLTGVETKFDPEDQDRGTLRKAEGVVPAPAGALSSGPVWGSAWGYSSSFNTTAALALLGTGSFVGFFTLTDGFGNKLLIAWDNRDAAFRGIWWVGIGTAAPNFGGGGGLATVAAPATTPYRGKTPGLWWYGSWCGDRLILGNGTDVNLVWKNGALEEMGPSATPSDPYDPAQARIPPCKTFVLDRRGVLFAAGNVTYPLRIYATEPPQANYPFNEGLKNADRSWRAVTTMQGTEITALSWLGGYVLAHLNRGGCVVVTNLDGSPDGWKFSQAPAALSAGALNPNCVRDAKVSPLYFGTDLEIYRARVKGGYDATEWRERDLATDRSSGDWNALMLVPQSLLGTDGPFVIYDEKNGRLWVWAALRLTSKKALYCYDERSFAVTGPIRYPDLICATHNPDPNAVGCVTVGISRGNSLVFADLGAVGEPALPTYADAIGADYAILGTVPTVTVGIPYVGVSADGTQFKQVLDGQVLNLATAWSDWAIGDVTTTRFFKNASIGIIEIRDEDFGSPDAFKEFLQARLQWLRNTRAYVAVFAESEGRRSGKWRGTMYPKEEMIAGLTLSGRRLTIRIVIVLFNDKPCMLHGLSVDHELAAPN